MDILIQNAHPSQADLLTDIAVRAKSHWGYTSEQIEHWREFLTITPDYISAHAVSVAHVDEQVAGFAAIEDTHAGFVLEHLWILPDYIGKGIGKQLFLYVASRYSTFIFTADPNADGFYYKMGAQKIGEYPSTAQGRLLTQFKYTSHKLN